MAHQPHWQKIIFLFFFLILVGTSFLFGKTDNEVWLGEINELQIEKTSEHKVLLKVFLAEYTKEGTFDSFDETTVLFINREPHYKKWAIILDNIAAGKLKNYKKQDPVSDFFLEQIEITQKPGSYVDPNRTQSKGGYKIHSSYLIFTSTQPVHIAFKDIEKKNTSLVVLSFEITDQIPTNGLTMRKNKYGIEVTLSDFEKERAGNKFLAEAAAPNYNAKMQDYFQQLRNLPIGSFRTMVYRVRHANINLIKNQLELLKSEVGQIGVLEPTSQIIMRDRSEYLLEMLQLITAIDVPVPQVMIDIHIVERTVENNSNFSAVFNTFRDTAQGDYGLGLGNANEIPMTGSNVSGVYTNLKGDALKSFETYLNAEIQQGKAYLRATTRLLCRNRELAKLNSGNSIPYYRLNEVAYMDKKSSYKTQETTPQSHLTESTNIDGETSTTNTTDKYQRDYAFDQKENQTNRSWKVEFIQTGVNLQIRPYIKNSEWVELDLKPSYSEITGLATTSEIPILSNRSLETIVTIQNGSTILLAGLFYEKELKLKKGIPLLMDLPLLGGLFSSHLSKKQQTEIIFILTVRVQ